MLGSNNDQSGQSKNTYELLKNLVQREETISTEKKINVDSINTTDKKQKESEIFTPYPEDPDDDNLKLF